jgi:hypothetical protein
LNTDALVRGEITGTRVSLTGAEVSMGVETCVLVPGPPEEILNKIKFSEVPSGNPEESGALKTRRQFPVTVPPIQNNFDSLQIDSPREKSGWLFGVLDEGLADPDTLHLSRPEAELLSKTDDSGVLTNTWRKILLERATAFQSGGLQAMAPYQTEDEIFNPSKEFIRLMRSRKPVLRQFLELIDPIMTGKNLHGGETKAIKGDQSNPGNPPADSLDTAVPALDKPHFYWHQSEIQGRVTLGLAAFLSRPIPTGFQGADVTFYASNSYFFSLSLYQLWPVMLEGRQQTLIWRGEYVITPSVLGIKGLERMAAENILLLEVKKSIRDFVNSLETP